MNKLFAAVAALPAMVMTPTMASAENVEFDAGRLKHLRFEKVETFSDWVQAAFTDDASKIVFTMMPRNAASFRDTKTGETHYMRCKEILGNQFLAAYQGAPKKFIKELAKAEAALHCPKGPIA